MAAPYITVARLIIDYREDAEGLGDIVEGLIDHLDAQDADPDLEPDLSTGAERWNVHMHTQPDLEIDEVEPVSA